MKIRNIILGIALTIGCGACNDWLTVQPETVITKDDMCTTDEGVRQLLSGMYWKMKNLYAPEGALGGGDGLVENLACTWYPIGERMIYLRNRDYTTSSFVISLLNTTFRDLYDVIAMANDLVECAERNKALLTDSVYNIGMGEALAMRACCHLDLVRLWGPSPKDVDAGKTYLPYVVKNRVDPYEYITFEKYMSLLQEDLDRAEEFLFESDPVVDNTFESSENSNAVWPFRKSRINYYGVLGLQARACLWNGDTEKALEYARMVIDAKNGDGSSKVRLMTLQEDGTELIPNYFVLSDPSAYAEHLCGVKSEGYDVNKGGWMGALNVQKVLYINGYDSFMAFKNLYDNNLNDLRYSKIWNRTENAISMTYRAEFKKYSGFYVSTTNNCKMNFPIVRLSEMYLIVMEKAPLAEANKAWEKFSAARGLDYVPYTSADREERVYKEWLREFIGEGQNFYTYKRYGADKMVFNDVEITGDQYILSIPEKEYLK